MAVQTKKTPPKSAIIVQQPAIELNYSSESQIKLELSLEDGLHLTEGASPQWSIYPQHGMSDYYLLFRESFFFGLNLF